MASEAIVTHSPPPSLAHSENLGELAAALAKAQAEIVGAVKDSANPFFKSSYADLASVWAACRKPLTANGLAVVQLPVMSNGGIGVTTMLLHSSGQWITGTATATPKDLGPQAIGSVITYLRRYALAAVAGVPQIDDDANAAEAHRPAQSAKPARRPAPVNTETGELPAVDLGPDTPDALGHKPSSGGDTISQPQQKRLFAIAKGKGWTTEQIKTAYGRIGVAHTAEIKTADYDDVIVFFEAGPVSSGVA